MKPVKVLAPILFAIGFVGYVPFPIRADTKTEGINPTDSQAYDATDVTA